MRYIVVGTSGSGKSRYAQALAERLALKRPQQAAAYLRTVGTAEAE